jgi:hypothetical protein
VFKQRCRTDVEDSPSKAAPRNLSAMLGTAFAFGAFRGNRTYPQAPLRLIDVLMNQERSHISDFVL